MASNNNDPNGEPGKIDVEKGPESQPPPQVAQRRSSRLLSRPPQNPSKSGYNRLSNTGNEEELLVPKASVLLPVLQQSEKLYFELVHSGDVNRVRDFLEQNPGFNINCVNFQGVSALLVALQAKLEPMVEFLLQQPGIDLGDCILHAIRERQKRILEMLLEKQQQIAPSLEFVGVTHSSDFPDYVTPLILAAQCGHYEIIQMLIERGHTISKPHSPTCRCMDCREQLEGDDLLHAENLRLNLYRSVCNPAYIFHSSTDPILTSFLLSTELKQCSMLIAEFRAAYVELSEAVASFAVDLVGCCRDAGEVELVLKQKEGIMKSTLFPYPRLMLAMDLKQKAFVAHPHCQHVIGKAWTGSWSDYNLKPLPAKLFYPCLRILMLPFICVMCLMMPKHALVQYYNIPLNRMINHTAAYLVFLILIFMESNQSKENQKRKPPHCGLEPVIVAFVIGHIWNTIRMCLIQGPKRFFKYLWNWHSVVSNIFFLLTFLFWVASYLDAINNDQIDLERKYWHHLDPLLIAEGCFVVATIMSFFKLMFFCRLNYYLGPLQISLGKMCSDMARYVTIFAIVILSFTAGLCRLYQPYDGMVQTDSHGIQTSQASSFVDFSSTLKTFFWAIFCMSSLESADVIIENLPGETEHTTIINKHEFTEAVGYIAFALFEVLSVTMLLNMLVATMCSTFQRVLDNLDIEWIFGKTDFYIEFIMQPTLPSPLNLIPTPLGISAFMEWFQTPGVDTKGDDFGKLEYPALLSQLAQRYFREKDSSAGTETDIEDLKQEIADLKATVSEIQQSVRQ